MARKSSKDLEESKAALLRTTADIASHALTQIECCSREWPEYAKDSTTLRAFVEKMVVHAREYGYVEKRGRV